MPSFTVYKGSSNGPVVESQTTRPDLKGNEVLVKITHSGLCYTDVHYKGANMGLGHEGAGYVEATGPDATYLKVGDRVGWGYNHDSCGHCKECLSGNDIYCAKRKLYGNADLDQGSMGSHAVWKESFLFKTPDGITNEHAAPLQCGGVTVYSVLQQSPVKAGDRVGVIGVGGLGHLAIQFAAKMGCEVVVFSGTDAKKDEAFQLGAKEFYATKGLTELKLKDGRGIDRLIITSSAKIDFSLYLKIMNPRGVMYPLSVGGGDLTIPYMPIIMQGVGIRGSVVGSRNMHREMLEFAAAHGVKPITMTFPMSTDGIEKAFQTLTDGDMRYRGVLVAQ